MKKTATVSVVIPTFRRAGLVRRAIDSVLNQTYKDVEVLVVDDGSPDHTRDVVAGVHDERVRYLRHDRNRGLPAARNTGIKAATGEYIAFLDDDDMWLHEKLEKQVPGLRKNCAVLCGYVVDETYVKVQGKPRVSLEDLKKGNEHSPSCLMARTGVLRERLFDEALPHGEDWDMLIRIAQEFPIGYVPRVLVCVNDGNHQRMTNSTKNSSLIELESRMAVIHKHAAFFGTYWARYHIAKWLLSYLGSRKGKIRQLSMAVARCGITPVCAVLNYKVKRRTEMLRQSLLTGGTNSGGPGRRIRNRAMRLIAAPMEGVPDTAEDFQHSGAETARARRDEYRVQRGREWR